MSLSLLSILLGLIIAAPTLYGLARPETVSQLIRRFPRSTPLGYFLITLGTIWFLYNFNQERVADFASYRKLMFLGFVLLGIFTAVYIRDFLAVRALSVVILLLAKLMVDTARFHESAWRLVIVVTAYLFVIAGIWFTISPWRLRDIINWAGANTKRLRIACGLRLAFGLLLIVLGIAVF
ncbi:MAG: hypothetical protein K9N48_09195 [Verrucomicrobia bacterium]|nr:hypothetical protein [Verrucomicrobiota bacterium]MCF7707959.1 hypothetical protein [Verrucomicrobiota bacterium]